jgi:hypothetical protein
MESNLWSRSHRCSAGLWLKKHALKEESQTKGGKQLTITEKQ